MKSKKKKRTGNLILQIIKWIIVGFFALSIGLVCLYKFVPVYVTPLMISRSVEALWNGEKPRNEKEWVPIEKISPNLVRAVIASEDNLYMQHNGFSVSAIKKAIEDNKKGRRIRGGSTISQQTAKNVFLPHRRSYIRKAFEAYYTVLIELIWGKERIMEVYLNVIETGNGIYGAEAASRIYFGISAARLSTAQAARIAACLPNPRRFNAGKPSAYILRRQNQIQALMPKMGKIDLKSLPPKKKEKKRK